MLAPASPPRRGSPLPWDDDGLIGSPSRALNLLQRDHPIKMAIDHGVARLVVNFPQGYVGVGAERTESGEIYVGGLQGSKRHGPGIFRAEDGCVVMCTWEKNRSVGEGVHYSADHLTASRLVDGKDAGAIPIQEAQQISTGLGLTLPAEWATTARSEDSPRSVDWVTGPQSSWS
jgi:hypothetical protein